MHRLGDLWSPLKSTVEVRRQTPGRLGAILESWGNGGKRPSQDASVGSTGCPYRLVQGLIGPA
ncbi:hypothetical protein GLAREA_00435 [Glarea lozoyensis ATCC 20868]|uniref:Uncharacterized protein n=1 Tax=Glarea lozoyensis (strain ATCC 20868 / MF5171) TaxID=1116229 RepID=S3CUI9_GLAL2|nr:uncharacterized protein GLAREA_00435 [Glarea lozoyensis ATCC 20868]EPE29275.1 hypothetical protein GLAREA_00435 [Glarea lozoyensis ATCC 20868]